MDRTNTAITAVHWRLAFGFAPGAKKVNQFSLKTFRVARTHQTFAFIRIFLIVLDFGHHAC